MFRLSSDLVIAATLDTVRNGNVDDLNRRMSRLVRKYSPDARIFWRPNSLTDFRGEIVPSGAERLSRWDDRHPDEIFMHGFRPHTSNLDDIDLWCYVNFNQQSIFVGTTRYQNRDGRNYRWQPRRNVRFEYEVLANGGIDVNECLGNHCYYNQHEIVFPGGIRPEFIRTAREYNPENMNIVRIWANGGYDCRANGANTVRLVQLADPVVGPSTEVRYWTGDRYDSQDYSRRVKRSAAADSEAMHEPGEQEADDLMVGDLSAKPIRTALANPNNSDEAYMFAGTEYVLIKVAPGSRDDEIVNGPKIIENEWPSLKEANFAMVDAAYPSPAGGGETYFFSQGNYVLIRVKPGTTDDEIIGGPHKIWDKWPSLRNAGFTTVDAVLPSPTASDEAYFFSGNQYALIKVVPGTTDDYIINGPKVITQEWPSLEQAGFSSVDAVLPSPNGDNQAYFFKGNQYALIKVVPGTRDDVLLAGPKSVKINWPSLAQAGFY